MNRIRSIACLGLLLTAAVPAAAQVAPPPPGFTPADEVEAPPPASGFLQNHGLLKPPRLLGRQVDAVSAEDQSYFNGPPPPLPYSDGARETEWSRYDRPPPQPVVVEQTPVVLDAPRVWLRAEALYWWTKSSPLPASLVTSGSAADAVPGALGQPGTSVLIGDENIGISGRGGGRFTLGFALDN
ncbi:MAG TPA: BBP7 family outer membrane beta-barrel protein, partial [Planctomycetaceae bacterium]|nr:BBP7 family outer membrane beta-barrel protein [Planctomycetaceae bacterium]